MIRGETREPLAGLVSGALDVDKLDYLSRDAWMCGVPYGVIDVDRLLASLTLAPGPGGRGEGRVTLALQEKGVSALESLLFAKYQMFRNVYWHHAVRSATCMFKRAVRAAAAAGSLGFERIAESTDDGLTERLLAVDATGLTRAVQARRLYKRALDLSASEAPSETQDWVSQDSELLGRVEDALARELGLEAGQLLLDFPSNPSMLAVDLPLLTRSGRIERLTGEGRLGQFGLPRVAGELYQSARRLRIFTAERARSPERALEVMTLPKEVVERRLKAGEKLLGS